MGQVDIIRKNGGLGRRNPSEDAISGLVFSVGSYDANIKNKVIELNSLTDAVTNGITATKDATYSTKVYSEIEEFYRIAPGVKLFVLIVDNQATLTQLTDKSVAGNLIKVLRSTEAKGRIRQVAVCADDALSLSFGDVLTRTVGGGGVVSFSGAVVNAQALAIEEEGLKRPVHILVEGKRYSGAGSAAVDLRESNCNLVSVFIGKNNNPADSLLKASVGTCLGMIAKRKVNECIGFVGEENSPINGNIQDDKNYTDPKLSSNLTLASYSDTDWTQLDVKGYIYPKTYIGRPGVFLNDSHTCAPLADDYCTIENVRTIQKAERIAYKALVPSINSSIKINADGTLPQAVCSHFQNVVNVAIRSEMQSADEISSVDSYVDSQQNLLATSELQIELEIIPTGVARKIKLTIGFKNPFKN